MQHQPLRGHVPDMVFPRIFNSCNDVSLPIVGGIVPVEPVSGCKLPRLDADLTDCWRPETGPAATKNSQSKGEWSLIVQHVSVRNAVNDTAPRGGYV